MVTLVVGILAFLAGVYFAPDIRADVVKLDDYVKACVAKDKAAIKVAAKKGIDKL